MLNLFDNFDQASFDLLRSQRIAKFNIPTVILNDDGFLPTDIESPIQYFGRYNKNRNPMYFDQLAVPHYWRILSTANSGTIYDLDEKKANIIYSATDNSRQVKEVQWLDSAGNISWTDHYNQYGYRFERTDYQNGHPVWRTYFDKKNQSFLEWNLVAGDLFLTTNKMRHFSSFIEFAIYYLQIRHFNLDHILYNTLDLSLNISLQLHSNGSDTLFWHEKIINDVLPGNMQFLIDNPTRTKKIIFQNYPDWHRLKSRLQGSSKNVDFDYLGIIYPHPRANQLRPQALILTNSDEIIGLSTLVEQLPKVKFKIAAVTEMSEKLLSYQRYPNVKLYPNVSTKHVKELIATSDIYLDINRQQEILDAVRGAFEQNMLIVGFEETLHEPNFVIAENVFKSDEAIAMSKHILEALLKPALMKELIDKQRQMASEATVEEYRKKVGEVLK
ncbi:accessory Sec system glycosylation chaperone GtfB [Limosilactobacillus walteri]|uniref:UDP-N-acetylglucosamine--peptide N-acetylglucosaminyltransferase stabilizing protein GtfB n=1 Tax=Limosilactobacillus walteri TaxID=2268022 RepID=A0ABR8P905_9LACO|nr:accessory Sec system glycosylation chaperone GtfB [Limosilactobacillus walteri]MBD5807154.1 accessory Sec system glycosylation chaperone GtfB [Limosilactobacillus walteri]